MTTNTQRRFNASTLAIGAIAGCGLAAAMVIGGLSQAAPATLDEHDDEQIRLGTYDPQATFQQYLATTTFHQEMEELQREAQEAQQQGDQQRLMEIEQRVQQMQNRHVQAFYDGVESIMPTVAEEAGVKIVALEIVYADESFSEPKDLTRRVVEQLNDEANAEREPEPDLPW
jgi:hypothetical protein